MPEKNKIILIFGPTASGKTAYSIDLAKQIGNAEIINADSMQVYKEIPIVTNQPLKCEKENIPHHLFGYLSITEKSDLNKWLNLAIEKINSIKEQGKSPIVIGGTGMYLKCLVEGISPIPEISNQAKQSVKSRLDFNNITEVYTTSVERGIINSNKIAKGDTQRIIRSLEVYEETGQTLEKWNEKPNIKFFDRSDFDIRFIDKPRDEIYQKIDIRFEKMVENGVLEEAKKARKIFEDSELTKEELNELPAYRAIGLREAIEYLKGNGSLEEAIKKSQQASRNYAKRQLTWWRGWSKKL